ncbi:hypothetical protein B0H14DRAFT_2616435 [Mycena olivaceomarginata]|nr:hypothetical protein B0H14DRAFT_2616435 [Mycena olivaceomarginata]
MTRSNGWLLSCPSSPLHLLPACCPPFAVSGLGCLGSLLFPQVPARFFKMFSHKSSSPQDFSQGFNPHPRKPTRLKNHGFPQGFNLLDNAVNSPQVVKNICTQNPDFEMYGGDLTSIAPGHLSMSLARLQLNIR